MCHRKLTVAHSYGDDAKNGLLFVFFALLALFSSRRSPTFLSATEFIQEKEKYDMKEPFNFHKYNCIFFSLL